MNDIALPFAEIRSTQAKHQAVITLAAKIRDWQTLLFAVEDMIADQRDFVAWWDEHVRDAGNPALIVAGRQQLAADDATKFTGIQKWQVSRWRTALEHEDAYRDHIIEAAQRKAGLRDKDRGPAEDFPHSPKPSDVRRRIHCHQPEGDPDQREF